MARWLVDHGRAVPISADYLVPVRRAARPWSSACGEHFSREPELTFGGFRELSGLTRKLGIPMLEHLDQAGVTARDGDLRRAGPALADGTIMNEPQELDVRRVPPRAVCAPRRATRQIDVGGVPMGGGAPVRVQSMTTTRTGDVQATLEQIRELATAGAEYVRVTVNDQAAADAMPQLVREANLPLIADIHYDHTMALASLKAGVAKLRINPGNIGSRDHVREVARAAQDLGVPIRIGVNRGSLHRRYDDLVKRDPAGALVQSALDEIEVLAAVGFHDVAVSLKSSTPAEVVDACRRFSALSDVPQHLGVTEAGTLLAGTSLSVAAMSVLLGEGIGDTVRISLADDPVYEVKAAFHMLQALGLREGYARVVACPTCGRVEVDVVALASRVEELFARPAARPGDLGDGVHRQRAGRGEDGRSGHRGRAHQGRHLPQGRVAPQHRQGRSGAGIDRGNRTPALT